MEVENAIKLQKSQYIYILECADGTLYTGWTTDPEHRLRAHNSGRGAKYTRSRTPVRIVYLEEYDDKGEALSREAEIKRLTREEKKSLISRGRGTVFLSEEAGAELVGCLTKRGYSIETVRTEGIVAEPVSAHPDMFMCKLGVSDAAPVVRCLEPEKELGCDYPADIAYNAACTGRFFIHNLKHTASKLLETAQRIPGMTFVDVRQGYAKCSIVVADEESVITYDRGIAAACIRAGMKEENILIVEPGHVLLKGYDTGFIGGATGRIGDTVYFNGDLSGHPDCERIVVFLEERGLKVWWFSGRPLTDIGSVIVEDAGRAVGGGRSVEC